MIDGRQTGSDTLNLTWKGIADDLARRIRSGEFEPGEKLEYSELKAFYGVSGSTLQRAMGWVENWGLVEYRPGRGMFTRSE